MNIFKVLANGDGRINEANISSFLAYLLDPKEDHGLNFEFLRKVLSNSMEDLSFPFEKYEYEIFLEQAFISEISEKHIVDLVIVCYSINKGEKKESLVKEFINNTKKIERVFLIENKINTNSVSAGQLINQFESTKRELDFNFEDKIHTIYITPKEPKSIKEFQDSNLKYASHLFWKSLEKTNESIYEFIVNLLEQDSKGTIEPLSEHILYTLKAFNQFIDNDFKSLKVEEKERKNDYSYTNECIRLNEESQIEQKLIELKSRLLVLNPNLNLFDPSMKKVCEPELCIYHKGIGISLYAGHKSRSTITLVYRVFESRKLLDLFANRISESIKKANYGDAAYFKQDWMKKQIPIEDSGLIFDSINKALMKIDEAMSGDNTAI